MKILLESLAITLLFEFALFVLVFLTKRNDFADVGWGLGFGVLAIHNFFQNPNPVFFQKILFFLILAWSLRLAGHLGFRMIGKAEDQRYQEMQAGWKENLELKSLFYIFFLQGFLLWILAIPLIFYLTSVNFVDTPLSWGAFALSLTGLIYESIADSQKSIFKRKNHDTQSFIQSGLFKFSRYPQYFGEITFWTGVALFPMTWGLNLFFLCAPLILATLLLKVSGVPLLEKKYIKRKGYLDYALHTPLLFPNFFKSN